MHKLPFSARLYLLAVVLSAWALGGALLPQSHVLLAAPIPVFVTLIGLLLANQLEIVLERPSGQRYIFTVDEAFSIFAVSTLNLPGVWLIMGAIVLTHALRRRPLERVFFNGSMLGLTYCATSLVYTLVQPSDALPFAGPVGLVAFVAVACTHNLCNNLLVGTMAALATRQPVLRIYRENLLQVNWVQLLTFIIGASMAALYAVEAWLLLYGLCTLALARSAFATVVRLTDETRERQALAEERATLYEEQARLNHEIAQQQTELARASKLAALGTFSAGIAHEFNNVLTAVLGHAQVGQMVDTFAEKNYALDVIVRVCQRATGITASLLTFARQREPDLAPEYLQTALEETLALVGPDLRGENIHLVQMIEDVPILLCDLGQLNQVLLNLITNARDALRERPSPTLKITLQRDGDDALLVIADNGAGMPPAVLDTIFQPFVTTKKKGNGLGMAICYGIIESHKGKIGIASELGAGTTVTIRLPLALPEAVDQLGEPALSAAA